MQEGTLQFKSLYCRPNLCLKYPEAWSSSFLSIYVFKIYSPRPPSLPPTFVCDPLHLTGGPPTFNWGLLSGALGWGHILDVGQYTSSYIIVECAPHNLELPIAPQVEDILWDPPPSMVECSRASLVQVVLVLRTSSQGRRPRHNQETAFRSTCSCLPNSPSVKSPGSWRAGVIVRFRTEHSMVTFFFQHLGQFWVPAWTIPRYKQKLHWEGWEHMFGVMLRGQFDTVTIYPYNSNQWCPPKSNISSHVVCFACPAPRTSGYPAAADSTVWLQYT